MGNPAEGGSHTHTSSLTPGTRATSPYTGIGHDDDVFPGVSSHVNGGYLAHRTE